MRGFVAQLMFEPLTHPLPCVQGRGVWARRLDAFLQNQTRPEKCRAVSEYGGEEKVF